MLFHLLLKKYLIKKNINTNFPDIEKPVLIHPNYFLVVCQNEVGTIGRNIYLRV